MAANANATKIANLLDPQVIGDRINKKLFKNIRFAPLATVYTTLEGRPGSTVTLPSYNLIGTAEVVAEGADMPIKKLTESTVDVTIHKIGLAVELTDEAILDAYGDPAGEAADQIMKAIATKVDDDLAAAAKATTTLVKTLSATFKADDVADALVLFGEDINEGAVLMVDAAGYATLRKSKDWIPNTEIGANMIISGVVGSIYGCQVAVSEKIDGAYFIIRQGALAIYSKRNTIVEVDRDIVAGTNVIAANKHFATYLQDANKLIKIVLPS